VQPPLGLELRVAGCSTLLVARGGCSIQRPRVRGPSAYDALAGDGAAAEREALQQPRRYW